MEGDITLCVLMVHEIPKSNEYIEMASMEGNASLALAEILEMILLSGQRKFGLGKS